MKKIYFYFFIILLFNSCEYFSLMSKKEWEDATDHEKKGIVYTSGIYIDDTAQQNACYWINGKRKSLGGDTVGTEAVGKAIYVVNGNVYVGGSYQSPVFSPQACYWKNGEFKEIQLDYPGNPSQVISIVVKNDIVFMVGYEWNGSMNKACYWVNEIKYPLYTPNGDESDATSIYVTQDSSSKPRIYIAGSYYDSTYFRACYWSDGGGNLTTLDSSNNDSRAQSIFLSGNTIYTSGYIETAPYTTCYWKSDNSDFKYTMPLATFNTDLFITTSGDIHIIANASGPNGYYWKNGKLKYSIITTSDEFNSIYVFNDDVYVAGYIWDLMTGQRAAYWTDVDELILVEDDENSGSNIYSIFVTSE